MPISAIHTSYIDFFHVFYRILNARQCEKWSKSKKVIFETKYYFKEFQWSSKSLILTSVSDKFFNKDATVPAVQQLDNTRCEILQAIMIRKRFQITKYVQKERDFL